MFKRDSFTCQYCGGEAPDVILNVDHIVPVAKGGGNGLTNLVTSCFDCNSGKKDRELSDDTIVKKQMRQLKELQEQRQQIEMIAKWHAELCDLTDLEINTVEDRMTMVTGYVLNPRGKKRIKKLLKEFGLRRVLECVDISMDYYIEYDNDGEVEPESFERALRKIGGILFNKYGQKE